MKPPGFDHQFFPSAELPREMELTGACGASCCLSFSSIRGANTSSAAGGDLRPSADGSDAAQLFVFRFIPDGAELLLEEVSEMISPGIEDEETRGHIPLNGDANALNVLATTSPIVEGM
jgi:hypothetical protein